MNQALWKQVSGALSNSPSEQPVKNAGNIGSKPDDAHKQRQSIASGIKMKQKGNPTRSYSVSVIDKAKAKIG